MARKATAAPSTSPVGRQGRVTGTVGPGLTGEVMLAIRGGTEAFNAYPFIGTETVEVGAQVVVMDAHGRSLYVSAI